MNKTVQNSGEPWYKFGFVWMVIAGPAIVVVAAFVTLYLAISRPNEIVYDDSYFQARQSDQSIEARRRESSLAPAIAGRNHATTGIVPKND